MRNGHNFKYFSDKDFLNLFYSLRKKYGIDFLANKFDLNKNTIVRWVNNNSIPSQYYLDLISLTNDKEQISQYIKYISARNKDQFYTKPNVAKKCLNILINFLKDKGINYKKYTFIEPSAGCCSFFKLLPKKRRIGIDIDPKGNKELIKQNFLEYKIPDKKTILIGNPPFGLRGNLALRFINHAKECDFIAMILPPLFESDGKGTPKNRVLHHKLVYSTKLPLNSFQYPDGKSIDVATLFQIWAKKDFDIKTIETTYDTDKIIKIYSLSNGPTSSSKRNVKMIDKCDVYLPSTCFSGMKAYKSFYDLPNKRGYGIVILDKKNKNKILQKMQNVDWSKDYAFLSTNSALNLRSSLIKKCVQDILK